MTKMVSTKLCTTIRVVLFVSATVQVLIGFAELGYWLAFGAIMILSAAKAVLIAACFRHLRFRPRSLTYLVYIDLVATLTLTLVALYSLL